eukprot:TRINITY_DN148_c0_g2_i1.p1 TRINITY_DN148_c0_g2~~TRINITY_DN148_c0_g2_i1.p1  ORF type:complete len:952 (+),score=407.15 TRINITY_DN148_c0_g2_i1:81-2858(+)
MRAAAAAVMFAAGALAADPCTSITDCTDCVNSVNDCGWCSTKVIYQDGTVGTQCVSPSAGDPFSCSGIYSTEECQSGYVCNSKTYMCEKAAPGEGTSQQECLVQCVAPPPPGPPPPPGTGYECQVATGKCTAAGVGKGIPKAACEAGCVQPQPPPGPGPTPPTPTPPPTPATVYVCDTDKFQCKSAAPGTPGSTSKEICEESCQATPPPGPPTPEPPPTPKPAPHPPSPPAPPSPPTPPLPPPPPVAKVYACDEAKGNCTEVPPGTPGSSAYAVCMQNCHATPPPPTPPSGYKCLFSNFTCVKGGDLAKADCDKACLGFYFCDTDYTCKPTNASTPGATSQKDCEANCAADWTCDAKALKCNKGTNGTTKAKCDAYCQTSYQCQDDLSCKAGPPGSGIPNKTLCEQLCVPSYSCNVTTLKCLPVAPSKGTSKDRCQLGCVQNYKCETDWTCKAVPPGQGYRNESDCHDNCVKPPPYYQCDYDTYKCAEVDPGSPPPATPNKTHCEEKCIAPPPTPGPPSNLKGLWRAIYVQNGYTVGEYDLNFADDNTVTIVSKTAVLVKGTVATAPDHTVLISVTEGAAKGKVIKGVYEAEGPGAETTFGELALGSPGGDAPLSVSKAFTTAGQTVFAMSKCLSQACAFTMEFPKTAAARRSRTLVNDPCLAHGTSCQACLAFADYCGWCTNKVVYVDGSQGTQCAGTALGIEPFTCNGVYSTSTCPSPPGPPGPTPPGPTPPGPTPPTPPGPTPPSPPSPPSPPTPPSPPVPPTEHKYQCNFTSLKCVLGGKQTSQDCANFCKSPQPVPPDELIGYWRGFQIRNAYAAGEWDINFTQSVTSLFQDGKKVWDAHVQTYGGVYMRFDIVKGTGEGKSMQAEYQKTNINEMMAITMAWSALGGTMPGSFDEAMKAPEDSHNFFKCTKDANHCKFHS